MAKSYITLLNGDNYLKGVLCLNESLKRVNAKYPLIVAITQDVSEESKRILNDNNIKTIVIKKMKVPECIKEKNSKGMFSHWTNTFDKLQIFEMTQFEKIVFLDSDMYVRKNIDNLFECKNLSAVIDRREPNIISEWKKLTSGTLVIEPKEGFVEKFVDIMKEISEKRESIGDQDVLQEYDKDWGEKEELHLDVSYNTFFIYLDYYIKVNGYQLEDISVIHFILKTKPWNLTKGDVNKYLEFLDSRLKYNYEKTNKDVYKKCLEIGSNNKKRILCEYLELVNDITKKNYPKEDFCRN